MMATVLRESEVIESLLQLRMTPYHNPGGSLNNGFHGPRRSLLRAAGWDHQDVVWPHGNVLSLSGHYFFQVHRNLFEFCTSGNRTDDLCVLRCRRKSESLGARKSLKDRNGGIALERHLTGLSDLADDVDCFLCGDGHDIMRKDQDIFRWVRARQHLSYCNFRHAELPACVGLCRAQRNWAVLDLATDCDSRASVLS